MEKIQLFLEQSHNRIKTGQQPIGARQIAVDCRYFLGDRPCIWHKSSGALCSCEHYKAIEERLLVIKLDAMGDVLRTTALLPPLAEQYPGAYITWITRRESQPLLERNPYIVEILTYGEDALLQLSARSFDRVINLDASKVSAALSSIANAPRKDGFTLDQKGWVKPSNEAALTWLQMGLFDDLKRQGTRTYQDMMADIIGVAGRPHRYILELSDEERRQGRVHLQRLGIDLAVPIVGLNTGAGRRWELKQWHEEGYLELVERIATSHSVQFVLLGGPEERERHGRLLARSTVPLIDAGCDNPVRHFASIVGACHVVVTGDTLAMHLALALRRRAVVLFGPTSAPEIELYGLGEKVVPQMDCLGCYKSRCNFVPNCMDMISVNMVSEAVERQLRKIAVDSDVSSLAGT